jgi:hypothetical protein
MPYAFITSLVPAHSWTDRHKLPDKGADPQKMRESIPPVGGFAVFVANLQTVGTDDMNVIPCVSISSPSRIRMSALKGGST